MRDASKTYVTGTHLIVATAAAVALIGTISLLLLGYQPSGRPVDSRELVTQSDTAAAAKAAGATVAPTDPKTTLKPLEVPAAQPKPPA